MVELIRYIVHYRKEKCVIICSEVQPLMELDQFVAVTLQEQIGEGLIHTLSLIGRDPPHHREYFIKQFSDHTSLYDYQVLI